ncbi:metallopeptidase TldD-related protein [Enhydrobacter sp.]|jgi:PmbA protein|uniref:TldD/PmbA family protein n=1 Tax=Enhydrobacter sp. TaxID=1894999 RepID=UPI002616B8C1|nr:metallopeptidase TldD-related protein [Enhydrobacter sp.]WIM12307.1 MAG: TldE protein, part of TldE/TldD proteolytic complex [Enhydrobacter sp.]
MAKANSKSPSRRKRPAAAPDANLLADLMKWARAAGADAADALYVNGESISVSQRLGKREKLESSEGRDLGLRVFVGRRQAFVSSTDFSPAALRTLAERAVDMARAVPEDPVCGIAPEELLARDWPDLDLDDKRKPPSAGSLLALSAEAEDAARAVKGVTNSEGAEASWGRTSIVLAASNGFLGGYRRSGYSLSCAVLAGEGTGMERDYEWSSAVHFDDLMAPARVGRNAGKFAVQRLNPKKAPNARLPVVYDRRISGGLIGHLAGAINGRSVARGTSFLKDRMGREVFAKGVRILDDPHRKRGLGSRPFDAEGLPTKRYAVVDDGVLTTWLLDLAAARQLNLAPTGHAARGTSGPPSPTTSNFYLAKGKLSVDELIADIKSGLYITDLIGFGVNGVTGDYSRGASGFWIENGKRAWPVSGITVAGNLKDMFLNMTPASDLQFKGAINAPTVRIEGMTIAGS